MRWIIAAAIAFFFAPSPAQAWGASGHYTVCEIAYLNLTPATKAEVDRLVALTGTFATFTETCTYPDSPPVRASEHFVHLPREVLRVPGPDCPGDRPCILSALRNDLAILGSAASDDRKATALLFIGHWFGDLHQPLHVSFADDRGGNEIDVLGACRFSLHSTWDTCIVESRVLGPGTDRLGRARAAAIALNAQIGSAQRAAWVSGGPEEWANESFQAALDPATGYCVRKDGECWYSASSKTFVRGQASRVQTIDDAYFDRAAPVVAGRLQRAAIRLADALNRVFDPGYAGPSSLSPPGETTPTPPSPPVQSGSTGALPAKTYIVHAIDVGTGLAIFIEGPDFTLLYDSGSNDDVARGAKNRVIAYLRAVRPDLKRIDHLILSHPHKDHSELMPDVIATYEIGNLWDSGALNPICSYRALLEGIAAEPGAVYHHSTRRAGPHSAAFPAKTCYGRSSPAAIVSIPNSVAITTDPIPLGTGASMTMLHADGTPQPSFNENSLVVRVDLGPRRILLPGDAEAGGRDDPATPPAPHSVEGELLATRAAELRSDILVAGHHGSKTSSRTAFLDAVGATQYIVSAGPRKYSTVILPDSVVVKEYEKRGSVWRTDVNDVGCATNPAKIGPDNDGKPGGCDNIIIKIDRDGVINVDTDRRAD